MRAQFGVKVLEFVHARPKLRHNIMSNVSIYIQYTYNIISNANMQQPSTYIMKTIIIDTIFVFLVNAAIKIKSSHYYKVPHVSLYSRKK